MLSKNGRSDDLVTQTARLSLENVVFAWRQYRGLRCYNKQTNNSSVPANFYSKHVFLSCSMTANVIHQPVGCRYNAELTPEYSVMYFFMYTQRTRRITCVMCTEKRRLLVVYETLSCCCCCCSAYFRIFISTNRLHYAVSLSSIIN